MFWGPRDRFDRVELGIDIFKDENIGAEKPLPLHARPKPLCDFQVERLLDIGSLRAPDRALWNLELNENILFLVCRVFRSDEFDGTDFADGHSAQLDEGAYGEIFDFARDIRFKYVALAKISLQAHRKERADKQQERSEIQQERIDLAARELAEVSDRLQAAANALRESI